MTAKLPERSRPDQNANMREGVRTNITKQEVASRELETAIALYLSKNDAVSIHVLASSAGQILYDVCKTKGAVSFRDISLDYIVPEYHSAWDKKMKQAFNYFKHARNDAFDELERFHPDINEFALWGACYDYLQAFTFGEAPLAVPFFFGWYLACHPDMMTEGFPRAKEIKSIGEGLDLMTPTERRIWCRKALRNLYQHFAGKSPLSGL